MRQPRDALFASNGDLIVSDTSRQVILVISPEGETRRTFGGSPGLSCPTALAYHDRRLYVLDRGSKLVQVFE